MLRSVSTRLATTAVAFLAASVFSGCCKSYVRATVEPCPPASHEVLVQVLQMDAAEKYEAVVAYVADDILPYCRGIEAILEE